MFIIKMMYVFFSLVQQVEVEQKAEDYVVMGAAAAATKICHIISKTWDNDCKMKPHAIDNV